MQLPKSAAVTYRRDHSQRDAEVIRGNDKADTAVYRAVLESLNWQQLSYYKVKSSDSPI